MERFHTIIVGAGLSGCAAAKTLISKGITNIAILEATDRVGGRVQSESLSAYSSPLSTGDYKIELGAQWIHGSVGNVLYDKMRSIAPKHVEEDSMQKMKVFSRTSTLRERCGEDISTGFEISSLLDDEIRNGWIQSGLDIEVFKQQSFTKLCDESRLSASQRSLARGVVRLSDSIAKTVEGYSPFDRSHVLQDSIWDDCGGKDYLLRKGMFSIFAEHFLPFLVDKIALSNEVKQIKFEAGGSVLINSEKVSYRADHVIVTPSLGYLKQNHRELFVPGLCADKVSALEGLHYGSVEKVYILFDTPPFNDELRDCDSNVLNFVLCDEAMEELTDLLQCEVDSADFWWKDVTHIMLPNPQTLLLWFTNEAAQQVKLCSDSVMTNVVSIIVKYFTGATLPQPSRIIRTDWANNKNFMGSYSAITKDYHPSYSEAMLEPINHMGRPVVFFAGEAYHPKFMSTMHGAYETGVSQALKLIKYLEN